MSAPSKVSGVPRNTGYLRDVLKSRRAAARKFAISDGAPVEVVESGPSVPARVRAGPDRARRRFRGRVSCADPRATAAGGRRGAGGAGSNLATAAASKGIQANASEHQDGCDVFREGF